MLAVPWIGTALALIVWRGAQFNLAWTRDDELLLLVVGLFLLDAIHVTYTFILVLGVPELREWARADAGSGFWKRVLLVGGGLVLFFYLLRFSPFYRTLPVVVALFYLVDAFGPSQHTLAQMRGISFCFHSAIRKSAAFGAEEAESALRIEGREKFLFRVLLGADFLAAVPNILIRAKAVAPQAYPALFHDLRSLGAAALLLTAVGIVLNGARYPRRKDTGKMAYLSRVFLFPMRVFIAPAGFVMRACHGTEYLVILRQMVGNSSASEAVRRRIYFWTFAVSILYGAAFVFTFPNLLRTHLRWHEPNSIYMYALMTNLVIRYLHYYMDGVLYRMNDPKTRLIVGPLLVQANASAHFIPAPPAGPLQGAPSVA